MPVQRWRVLVVDDDPDICRQLEELLSREPLPQSQEPPRVVSIQSFETAMTRLEEERFDLVVLDVRGPDSDEGLGVQVHDEIRKRRFLPIVFYTALPAKVRDLAAPLVEVVEKSKGFPELRAAIDRVLATGQPLVARVLTDHFDGVQRDYMWEYVSKNWEALRAKEEPAGIAHLLARRMALSVGIPAIVGLAKELNDPRADDLRSGRVPAARYYVVPPLDSRRAGDLFVMQQEHGTEYWLLLTPSCDLEQDKAEFALLAACTPLSDRKEFSDWQADPSKGNRESLLNFLRNNRGERFFFLPAAVDFPDLVVDFQRLKSPRCEELTSPPKASLDEPFAGAMLARFARYVGRLGTPDLDVELVLQRLTAAAKEAGKPNDKATPA
jgi:CheY-like chemotaxis protein